MVECTAAVRRSRLSRPLSHRRAAANPAHLALVGLGALYLALALPQIDRPLVYDDVNFAFAAQAVAETGLPFANAGHMSDRWDFSQREQWALWHPPLYIYLLGLQFKLFGVGEASARSLGLACGLASGLLVYLLARASAPIRSAAAEVAAVLASAFFLLSPLTIQSGLILDIDGTVLTLLLLAMAYVFVRFPPERCPRSLPVLSGLFALALWAKLTTPLGLLASLIVYRIAGRQLRQAGRELLIVGLGGAALFAASWGLVSALLAMPFEMPFSVTWIQLQLASESTAAWRDSPAAIVRAASPGLLWAGPYLTLLFAAAALIRLRGYLTTGKVRAVDLAIGFGLLVYLVYLIKLAGGFPKYHVAMLPFWSIAAAALVVEVAGRPRVPEALVLAGASVGLWRYFGSLSDAWAAGLTQGVLTSILAAPVALGAGIVGALYLAGGRGPGRTMALALTAMALSWGLAVEQRMGAVDYSTTYFYGTSGQRDAAGVLDAIVGPDEPYVASKDVAWYAANQRYLDQDTLDHFIARSGGFDGTLIGYDVRVLALWQQSDFLKGHYHRVLAPAYDLFAMRGDYAVWVRRSA